MIATVPTARTLKDSAIARLCESESPVLVEVRFAAMGSAPDWYLCHEKPELDLLRERLGPGIELHLSSVWNLRDKGSPIVIVNG